MKLSVITVCKNAARTIERTLRSVAEQTYCDIEYIVLDGGSNDGTQAFIERYRSVVSRFESAPDGGIYPAMNKGVLAATGDYLYFLNADDYLADPLVLADVAGFLEAHPDCDFVYGDIDVVRRSGRVEHIPQPPPAEALSYLILGCLPHQGSFARAELFQTIGPFDESYQIAADYDWFLRLLQHDSVRIRHYPRRIAYYSEGGMSTSRTAESAREMFRIQDRAPVYQTDPWRRQRLRKYQEAIVWYRQLLAHGDQHELVEQLREARRTIRFMEGTRFWKLRQVYVTFRQGLAILRGSVAMKTLLRSVAKRTGW